MRVVFACAGTGGHINPAIAIANVIKSNEKDSEFLFIGTSNGLENEIVPKSGYKISHVRTGKIVRRFTLKNISSLFRAYSGIGDAKKILMEFKPDLVIGTGGYICVPVMLASRKLKIPYILHESNAFPGLSVKLLANNAARVLVGFEEARARLKNKKNVVYTGNLARFSSSTMDKLDKNLCKRNLGLEKITKKIVLVTCGSQGAKRINDVIIELVRQKLSKELFFVLVAGPKNYDEIIKIIDDIRKDLYTQNINIDDYIKVERFVYKMEQMYKVADICITRAGAMTITELEIASRPAILIPLPYATENHQFYNAKVLEQLNVANIIEEKDLNIDVLYDLLVSMIQDINYTKMTRNFSDVRQENVSENIYKNIVEVLKK